MKKGMLLAVGCVATVALSITVVVNANAETKSTVLEPKLTTMLEHEFDSTPSDESVEGKYKNDAYAFSLQPKYEKYELDVLFKDDQKDQAVELLSNATEKLGDLTSEGTDFSAASTAQSDNDWKSIVLDLAELKNVVEESNLVNDLNNAGALVLQVESHYDEPSLQLLYKLISDLNAAVNGEDTEYHLTMTFDDSEKIVEHVKSKIK
ncbi:hypothetical protein NSQ26_05960 [Bacillus sp. FSL W7-1360]